MRNRVRLDTKSEINKFVELANKVDCPVYITNGDFRASAKSFLGVLYGFYEFDNIWVECEKDCYHLFSEFIVD